MVDYPSWIYPKFSFNTTVGPSICGFLTQISQFSKFPWSMKRILSLAFVKKKCIEWNTNSTKTITSADLLEPHTMIAS